MDAAIFHPTRNSIFAVRAGYVFEFSLALAQLATSKFVNPCFSKSCMAYDAGADKLWIGTMGSRGMGRGGDPGGSAPSPGNAGLYRINPASLALEQFVDPSTFIFGGLIFNGSAYVYTMPATFGNLLDIYGPESGFYDLMVAGGKLWGAFYRGTGGSSSSSFMGFDPTNPVGSNYESSVFNDAPSQLCYDPINVPPRVWMNQTDDLWEADWPFAVNADYTPRDSVHTDWNGFDSPYPPTVPNGAAGGMVFSPGSGGKVYMIQLNGTDMVKYAINGTIESTPTIAGATLGGQASRLRFNSEDNLIYIPCPATNEVIAFDPATDTVSHIYTAGLDAPHDIVFAPGHKIAVQFGPTGLKELTT
jgi:hypothetical protein